MEGRMGRELAKQIVNANRPSQSLGLSESSATLLSWDPNTLTGRIEYDGVVVEDLPVLSAIDAFGWQAGDTVLLRKWLPPKGRRRAGFGSWYIAGRVFLPGAANAAKVLDSLRNRFAAQIARDIMAASVISAEVTGGAILGGETDFVALPGSPGPTVTGVEIGSGVAVAFISCEIAVNLPSGSGSAGGEVGVAVSGATTVNPNTVDALTVISTQINAGGSTAPDRADRVRGTAVVKLDGLNPGKHDFELRYRNTGPTGSATFVERNLTVLAL